MADEEQNAFSWKTDQRYKDEVERQRTAEEAQSAEQARYRSAQHWWSQPKKNVPNYDTLDVGESGPYTQYDDTVHAFALNTIPWVRALMTGPALEKVKETSPDVYNRWKSVMSHNPKLNPNTSSYLARSWRRDNPELAASAQDTGGMPWYRMGPLGAGVSGAISGALHDLPDDLDTTLRDRATSGALQGISNAAGSALFKYGAVPFTKALQQSHPHFDFSPGGRLFNRDLAPGGRYYSPTASHPAYNNPAWQYWKP